MLSRLGDLGPLTGLLAALRDGSRNCPNRDPSLFRKPISEEAFRCRSSEPVPPWLPCGAAVADGLRRWPRPAAAGLCSTVASLRAAGAGRDRGARYGGPRIYAIGPAAPAAILVMLPGPGDMLTADPRLWAAQGVDVMTPSPSQIYQIAVDRQAGGAIDRRGAGAGGRAGLARWPEPRGRGGDGVAAALRAGPSLGRPRDLDDLGRRDLQRANGLFLFGERRAAESLGQQDGRCLPGGIAIWRRVEPSAAPAIPAVPPKAPRLIEASAPAGVGSRAAVKQVAGLIKSASSDSPPPAGEQRAPSGQFGVRPRVASIARPRRWRRRKNAGRGADRPTRCRTDRRPGTTARRTADRRSGTSADQTTADCTLGGVVRIGAACQRQYQPGAGDAGCNRSSFHPWIPLLQKNAAHKTTRDGGDDRHAENAY